MRGRGRAGLGVAGEAHLIAGWGAGHPAHHRDCGRLAGIGLGEGRAGLGTGGEVAPRAIRSAASAASGPVACTAACAASSAETAVRAWPLEKPPTNASAHSASAITGDATTSATASSSIVQPVLQRGPGQHGGASAQPVAKAARDGRQATAVASSQLRTPAAPTVTVATTVHDGSAVRV